MSQRELDRLLWELVDGTIDAAGRERLETHLAADADARERLAQIRTLTGLLDSVEELQPPEALKAAIDRALARRKVAHGRPRTSWTWLGELFAPRWRVRLAWAIAGLAVGVAAGIILFSELARTAGDDVSRFYGAMTRDSQAERAGLAVELPGSLGTLTLRRHGQALLVSAAPRGEVGWDAVLELTGEGLTLQGLQSSGGTASALEVSSKRIAVRFVAATVAEVRVFVPASDTHVRVRLSIGERELVNRVFSVGDVPPA